MRRLTVGDRVVALKNPWVDEGRQGLIVEVEDILGLRYLVLYDGDRSPYIMGESQIAAVPTEESPSKPTPKFKVGDKVRIKSREWYEANKDSQGRVAVPPVFTPMMAVHCCGKIYKIKEIRSPNSDSGNPVYILEGVCWLFSEEMFDPDYPKTEIALARAYMDTKSLFTGESKPTIKGNLPLIKPNKLLTNIKLD